MKRFQYVNGAFFEVLEGNRPDPGFRVYVPEEEIEKARVEARQRIADMLEREMNAPDSKDHDSEWNRALRYAIICIRPKFEASRLVHAEHYRDPKPLDLPKLGPGLIISTQDTESEKVIAMKVNDIIAHIKDIEGRIP